MPDELIQSVADAAELVVDGYAFLQEDLRVRIVHLYTGHVAVVDPTQGVIESNMQEIEEVQALRYLEENRSFLAA